MDTPPSALNYELVTRENAQALIDAAVKAERDRCATIASDAAKRYPCKKRRGVCLAIRDQIQSGS